MQMEHALTNVGMLKAQGRILLALMLRDIKTRFGGNEFGFLIAIGWPLSHILIILVIYTAIGRAAPYGDSAALWFATGIVPFMVFSYMSRFLAMGIVTNRPLLSFPVVKTTDLLFSRMLVELLSAGLVILIIFVIFWAMGIDFMPLDVVQAGLALLFMMLLGLGVGIIIAIIGTAFPFVIIAYALSTILLWMASGILFVPDALPEAVRTPLSYLPTVQGIEWMRSAYYEGFGAAVLDKTYLIAFGVVTLFIGLLLERLVRGKMMQ